MPPDPTNSVEEDDAYHSSTDSDFNDASLSPSSGGEDDSDDAVPETATKNRKPKKRKQDADGDLEMGSGDEGIIAQGRKTKRKKGKGKGKKRKRPEGAAHEDGEDVDEEDDEDGGAVGIRVKLRSGRGGQESVKKALPTIPAATADIASIWERMNRPQEPSPQLPAPSTVPKDAPTSKSISADTQTAPTFAPPPPETITIPHTYTFAGETHTSTKSVPITSPEAVAYLAKKNAPTTLPVGPTLRRPLARKNLLEPNPTRLIKNIPAPRRADLPASIGGVGAAIALAKGVKGRAERKAEVKLNTVEKSKLDWNEEVEREGLREELIRAERSGTTYLGRMEFLGRVDEGREEMERRARLGAAAGGSG